MRKHRWIKRILTAVTATVTVAAVFAVGVCAEENSIDIAAQYTLPNGFEYTVKAEKTDIAPPGISDDEIFDGKTYMLVLPEAVKGSGILLSSPAENNITLENKSLAEGAEFVLNSGTHRISCNGDTVFLHVMYTGSLPQIYITTSMPMEYVNEDKEHSTDGSVVITDGTDIFYNGGMEFLKGRGNVSWTSDKKPYSIKLSQKVSLFGMEPSRKYNLLANFMDEAFIRNKVTIGFADRVGVEYCTQSQFAELYINNAYYGLYELTEKVEVADGRVEIFDVDIITEESNRGINMDELVHGGEYDDGAAYRKGTLKWLEVPNDIAGNIGGGYLMELELAHRYGESNAGFVSDYGQPITIKSPEYASRAQVEFISSYYNEFEAAVRSTDGYNHLGRHYTEYADIESMARMYLLQEFVQNLDAGITSAYLYKDVNGKLGMCSPWDFDHTYGEILVKDHRDISDPENIWVAEGVLYGQENVYTLFSLLWNQPDFRREAVRQWKEVFRPEIQWLLSLNKQTSEDIYDSVIADYCRWNRAEYTSCEQAAALYLDEVEKMLVYIEERASFMDEFLAEGMVYVSYDSNGGRRFVGDKLSYSPGSSVTAKENLYKNDDHQGSIAFTGWNTKADGSGTFYNPGDRFIIEEDTVLYAQWERENQQAVPAQTTEDNAVFFQTIINMLKNIFR